MENSEHTHSLEDTVIAVLDRRPAAEDAIAALSAAGFDYEVLIGEGGRRHLDSLNGHNGVIANLARIVEHLGDEYRILDHLDGELATGKLVVSVDTREENADTAVGILRRHGGHYVWKFGEWAFSNVGE